MIKETYFRKRQHEAPDAGDDDDPHEEERHVLAPELHVNIKPHPVHGDLHAFRHGVFAPHAVKHDVHYALSRENTKTVKHDVHYTLGRWKRK